MKLSIYNLLDTYKKCLYDDWNKKYSNKFEFEDYLVAKIYIYDVPSCFNVKDEIELNTLLNKENIV